jgi:ubiquinone/menaquinone biosynthesis C-methylase UbiE
MDKLNSNFVKKIRRETVRKFYDNFAKNYDKNRYSSNEQKIIDSVTKKIVGDFVGDLKNKSILDCGCGTGRFAEFFAHKGAKINGIDISENMLNVARDKVPCATFAKADIFSLPFNNNTFDIIICSQVLTHLHKYKEPLAEMKRVLKDKGIIIIDVRNVLWPYRLPMLAKRLVMDFDKDYYPDYISIWRIKKICKKLGLEVREFRGLGFPVKTKKIERMSAEMRKSSSIVRYIAPTLILKIVKSI